MAIQRLDPIGRSEAAQAVLEAKRKKGITWSQIAEELDRSKVWTTAALLGRHTISKEQAIAVGKLLGLDEAIREALQLPPVRGAESLEPGEPVTARLEEIVQLYGGAVNELVREEFGDGVMSAVDFRMDVDRTEDSEGERVVITLDGKYLPYREF